MQLNTWNFLGLDFIDETDADEEDNLLEEDEAIRDWEDDDELDTIYQAFPPILSA